MYLWVAAARRRLDRMEAEELFLLPAVRREGLRKLGVTDLSRAVGVSELEQLLHRVVEGDAGPLGLQLFAMDGQLWR